MDPSISCHTTARHSSRWRLVLGFIVSILAVPFAAGTSSAAAASPAGCILTVLHGLPPSAYDVYVNGALTLDGFKAESTTPPLPFAAGHYDLAIRDVGAPATAVPVAEASVELLAGKNYSVIPHFDGGGAPMISLFENDTTKVATGRARLVLRDVAEVAPLDLRLDGTPLFTDVRPGSSVSTVRSPGTFSIDAVATGQTSTLVNSAPLNLREGDATIVYVVGATTDGTLDFMVQSIADLATNPGDVATGSGGLAADPAGVPGWVVATMAAAALGIAGALLVRRA